MNIVAYSYFRNRHSGYEREKGDAAKQFEQFLPMLVRAHRIVWSGWTMRLYHDDHIKTLPYYPSLMRLGMAGFIELRPFGQSRSLCGVGGMLERMRPAWEPDVDYLLCRDVDSIPSPRERRAVDEFIASGKTVHVIHDAPKPHAGSHSGIMGGTLGIHVPRFRSLIGFSSLEAFIASGPEFNFDVQGADQHLLNKHYAKLAPHLLLHGLHRGFESEMPGCEVRRKIAGETSDDDACKDVLCRIIGGCDWPDKALAYYDTLKNDAIYRIQECELGV